MAKYMVILDGGRAGIAQIEVSAKSMEAAIQKVKPRTDSTIKCVMTDSGRTKIYPNVKGTKVFADAYPKGRLVTINGMPVQAPDGALAYKHNDPTEQARWVYEESDLAEIRRQDPSLLVMVDAG